MKAVPFISALALLAFSNAHAAIVTWDSGWISGVSDVETTGSLVFAYDLGPGGKAGSSTNPVVNGVTFSSQSVGTSVNGSVGALSWVTTGSGWFGNATPNYASTANNATAVAGLDLDYTSLISDGFSVGNAAGSNVTITASGLTNGQSYLVQMWFSDARTGSKAFTTTVTDTTDNTNLITVNRQNTSSGELPLGSWVTGTFVAGDTGEFSFTLSGGNYVGINGIQLRAIPEPSTYALGAAGITLLALIIRRKRK
ncbi:MAG: PEP-CTERM sorting domain-containing protein [Puniceicoccales bacterium]|jgi:hypothetical protein|nr:PEP-CTERM sorting domain-containing protein [Puniceicoccales bacterium]